MEYMYHLMNGPDTSPDAECLLASTADLRDVFVGHIKAGNMFSWARYHTFSDVAKAKFPFVITRTPWNHPAGRELDRAREIEKMMQTPRILIKSSDKLVNSMNKLEWDEAWDEAVRSGRGKAMYGSGNQVPTCKDFAQHQANVELAGTVFHRTFMTRIASLLSELATLSNCSKKQTENAREIINIIGKKIGAKSNA